MPVNIFSAAAIAHRR